MDRLEILKGFSIKLRAYLEQDDLLRSLVADKAPESTITVIREGLERSLAQDIPIIFIDFLYNYPIDTLREGLDRDAKRWSSYDREDTRGELVALFGFLGIS